MVVTITLLGRQGPTDPRPKWEPLHLATARGARARSNEPSLQLFRDNRIRGQSQGPRQRGHATSSAGLPLDAKVLWFPASQ